MHISFQNKELELLLLSTVTDKDNEKPTWKVQNFSIFLAFYGYTLYKNAKYNSFKPLLHIIQSENSIYSLNNPFNKA